MKVVLFGATGMVGQGVLRECLRDPGVTGVLAVGRKSTGIQEPKLNEVLLDDLFAVPSLSDQLNGYDACFYCLGVSAVGMDEPAYRRITLDLTVAIARALVERNPQMTFIYVSGASTDSSGEGRVMWARVKGQAENAVHALPFKATYLFRPGYIQPMHGIKSSTGWYRAIYAIMGPLFPLLELLFPNQVTTTERVGRAMLAVARSGYRSPYLENRDINQLARS